MSNIKTQTGKVIGRSLNAYHSRVKSKIDELKFKENYQGRIIDCMVGEVDDNYIKTPETDASIVKLERSKEGVVKVSSIKGKTILVDANGNETDIPGEGCRLVSVGEEEDNKIIILSINKNLVPSQKFPWGINKDGQDNSQGSNNCTDYCLVKPNTNYITSINGNMRATNVFFYDRDKKFISRSLDTKPPVSFITPNNCYYTRHTFGTEKEEGLQLEMGEVITNYVPHKSHKTENLLDETLRKINNNVYDEIVGNKLIRRVGEIILDGRESNRLIPATHGSENFTFYIDTNELATSNSAINIISNTLPTLYQAWSNTQEGISIFSNKTIWVTIRNSKLQTVNLDGAKQWFKDNPTTIYYELAEPIIEELPNGITLQGFDDATIYIENSITPTVSYEYNALMPYKEEVLSQKRKVESNTLDVENNIIPYLMDMEFNLMLMEDK